MDINETNTPAASTSAPAEQQEAQQDIIKSGVPSIPRGYGLSSANAQKALADYAASGRYICESALLGAAQGGNAAQGMMNPLAAFIQGAAAGLQAPAQAFAMRQQQLQSVVDATPLAQAFPERAER